ncbi:MAG: hypothetical protein ACRERE_26115 [Candidatus Entotheonellia bacterium]
MAHYLQIPQATLRSWVVGRRYPTGDGTRFFEPLVTLPDPNRPLLSFMNVVEVHVHDDHFSPNARDEEWLSEVGRRQWVVLTRTRASVLVRLNGWP